ncbi:hypothetical protein ACIBHX_23345 [Nonomuraea sp. NPDC050536]|uniref:hypothetical protein n=1 Tax=Nonomuraea sp. NPDC050536 TaxID=3364366 RepID=UPI0037CA3308
MARAPRQHPDRARPGDGPTWHLQDLAEDLDAAYKQVAANPAVTVNGGRLNLAKLDALPLPDGYQAVHDAVLGMLRASTIPSCCWRSTATPGTST